MPNDHMIGNAPPALPSVPQARGPNRLTDGEHGRLFERLAAAYSWDLKIGEARRWPYRLVRRVMDVGTLDDILAMENGFGHDDLKAALQTADAGAFRPKSWTFWHYRLGLVQPGAECPPMPVRHAA